MNTVKDEDNDSSKFTLRDYLLYALYQLGGSEDFIDTEDLGVRAFTLYPNRFSLIKYREYPDMDLVKATLADLKKEKNGTFVDGDMKKGWIMTVAGVSFIENNLVRLEKSVTTVKREKRMSPGKVEKASSVDAAYKNRIKQSTAFKKWQKDPNQLTKYDFYDVFRIDQYTPIATYQRLFSKISDAVADSEELSEFLRHLNASFSGSYRGSN